MAAAYSVLGDGTSISRHLVTATENDQRLTIVLAQLPVFADLAALPEQRP